MELFLPFHTYVGSGIELRPTDLQVLLPTDPSHYSPASFLDIQEPLLLAGVSFSYGHERQKAQEPSTPNPLFTSPEPNLCSFAFGHTGLRLMSN